MRLDAPLVYSHYKEHMQVEEHQQTLQTWVKICIPETCTAAYIHTSVMETAMIIVTVVVKAMWLNNMEIINRLKDSEDTIVTKIEKKTTLKQVKKLSKS